MILTHTRESLIEALRARLPAAEKHDAVVKRKHESEEHAHLKRFRTACREALGWSYQHASKHGFWVECDRRGPTCPESAVDNIKSCLAAIERSNQKRYTIQESGAGRFYWRALMFDAPKQKGLCK